MTKPVLSHFLQVFIKVYMQDAGAEHLSIAIETATSLCPYSKLNENCLCLGPTKA